ncbi:MAG: hypothetical protein GWP08_04635 [Nitrospiraceae bacterium]|nr:hypothetical protein [Nitrospiraceae bacterium]
MYHLYSPAEFTRGEKVMLWPGRYDAEHPKSNQECVAQYSNLASVAKELAYVYRFFLAPLSCEIRIRRRIEAAIAGALYAAPGPAGAFQDRRIRYSPRTTEELPVLCTVTCDLPLVGLPEQIEV